MGYTVFMQRNRLFASVVLTILISMMSFNFASASPTKGTLVIDAQGLDIYCESGKLGVPSNIPMAVIGKTNIPKIQHSGNVSFKVLSGTYVITPGEFSCNGRKYSPLSKTSSVKIKAKVTTTAVIKFETIAEILFGRTWNDGDWWRIPLGSSPESVDFDQVQFRIVGQQGNWSVVNPSKWILQRESGTLQLKVIDTPGVDMEFRLVRHGYKRGTYQVTKAWYSPYTCGYNSCSYPSYKLIDSPLN